MLTMKVDKLSGIERLMAAKSKLDDNNKWLPLWLHLVDTAVVMEYLQDNWISSSFDGYSHDRNQIKQAGIFMAAIHDIGKLTPAFQSQIAPRINGYAAELSSNEIFINGRFTDAERRQFGHHAEGGALLLRHYGVCREIAVVIASHHGIIPGVGYAEEGNKLDLHESLFWESSDRIKWERMQKAYLDFALELAGFHTVEELPHIEKEVQMTLTGLLITADWIASNCDYFPLVDRSYTDKDMLKLYPNRGALGLDALRFPQQWKTSDAWKNMDLIQSSFGFDSNQMQKEVQQIAGSVNSPGLFIIEAPMGNGKTEASLAVAEIYGQRMHKNGLAFFLPSQATTNALLPRLEEWAINQTNGSTLALQLAHGSFLLNKDFEELRNNSFEEDGNPELVAHQFFCGSKSFLLANFVVGTIDQLLMAAVQQKHVMLKHLGLSDKVVIIDECHAYDAYMNEYLDRILHFLHQYKVPVIILSATLPARRRIELLEAYGENICVEKEHPLREEKGYPLLSWTDGDRLSYRVIDPAQQEEKEVDLLSVSEEDVIELVSQITEDNACVGIIVNTVAKAQSLSKKIAQFAGDRFVLYHSQYLFPDRLVKEKEIIDIVGRKSQAKERKQWIIVGTQVLEQSLDIDFDVLITEICPMDLLMQRIGRLQRHKRERPSGYERAKCYVIGLKEKSFDKGTSAIYGNYILKRTQALLSDKIMLPSDISVLVQKAYCERDIPLELETDYQQYREQREDQERRAKGYLLAPILHGRRSIKTIEGLSGNGVSEDSARASVRDGDPSIEVIVLSEDTDGNYTLISAGNSHLTFLRGEKVSMFDAKIIAEQKLRLPHCLSNSWISTRVIECLRVESDAKLGFLQESPWLKNELFLILDQDYRKTLLDQYCLWYSIEYGLVVTKGGERCERETV